MRPTEHLRDQALTGEHRIGDAGQIVLACLFLVLWGADSFHFRLTTFLNEVVPLWFRVPAAIALLVVSAHLSRNGLRIVFHTPRPRAEVIREGVFRWVRHPVYLGEILLYLALLLFSLSLAAAGVWLLVIIFLHAISRYEERLLTQRFGDEYRRYMEEVPMWIPWFSPRIAATGRGEG